MSVTVQLMSGTIYSFDIFDGYRIRNLRYELYTVLRNEDRSFRDSERIVFTHTVDREYENDREYEQTDDMDFIEDGDHYYAFVREEEERLRVRLTLGENGVMCLRHQNGQLIRYCGWEVNDRVDDLIDDIEYIPIEQVINDAVIEVNIEDDAYDVMRRDIRSMVADEDDDDEILEDLDDDDRVLEIFCQRFVGIRVYEIVIV